ncbi:Protein of unknown function [Actinokineospora alba]|uniref:DUF2975 domain-containing protein n=1 Tax=Actinokineospora alba TaxID=504798 RepID=A0A1H0VDC5_9PSEU|nr:DUF2975 domain-containing protein [Actinokineospora alba]TDP65647.1 hypothetical protein C8E96_1134 [Actinokineospora alba]SDH67479.1 Protein of unknown function [Actinokineospora alba]SDP76341.1 Protein of unknown function [Actinokineospora alba]
MTKNPLDPIQTWVTIVFAFIVAVTAITVAATIWGSGSLFGLGSDSVCAEASQGVPVRSTEESLVPESAPGVRANVGSVNLCTQSPSAGQRALLVGTQLPSFLVFAGALSLAMAMFRAGRRHGVLTDRFATRLRIIGWVVIGGSVLAAVAEAWARRGLLQSMLEWPLTGTWVWDAELSVLAIFLGTLLISFARVLRISARMREDLAWTV